MAFPHSPAPTPMNWEATRKNIFAVWKALLKWSGGCGSKRAGGGSGKRIWLASCHPLHKGHCLLPQDVLQAYWDKFGAFHFSMEAAMKKSVLAAWKASPKNGGNCEFMNGL